MKPHQIRVPHLDMPSVIILTIDHVTPSPEFKGSGFYQEKLPLSCLDVHWLGIPHTQPLFLYPTISFDSFPTTVQSLKSSLSKTLTKFYPLAGKLAYVQDTGDVIIDCTDCSVEFIEAEYTSNTVDIKKVAESDVHDTVLFMELVPEIDRSMLPIPVMAVKVTRFSGGGVAIGLALHHAVMDGVGNKMFYEAWSAVCRGDVGLFDNMAVIHDRKVLKYPNNEELARDVVKKSFPNLPLMGGRAVPMEERLRLQRRTFTLSSSAIQSLKKHILMEQPKEVSQSSISTFTTVAAHIWVCFARMNISISSANEMMILLYLMDYRSRVKPPISGYTGNCLRTGSVEVALSELQGPEGLSTAQVSIARAIKKRMEKDLYDGDDGSFKKFMQTPNSRRIIIAGSNRFLFSDTDFGWGKPGRFEAAGMNSNRDAILHGMEGGVVKASFALEPDQMDLFAKFFYDGLGVV